MAQAKRVSSAIAPLRIGGVQNDPQNSRAHLHRRLPGCRGNPRHHMSPNYAEPTARAG